MKKRFFAIMFSMMMGSSLSLINVSSVAATEKINAPKVTTAPKQTTKPVTTTAAPAQPSQPNVTHEHKWTYSTVNETISHPAEYGTRTYWWYDPVFMDGPAVGKFDKSCLSGKRLEMNWMNYNPYCYNHSDFSWKGYCPTDFDFMIWKYGDIDNIPKTSILEWITDGSMDPTYYNDGFFCGVDSNGNDVWDNQIKFNPNTDVLVVANWPNCEAIYNEWCEQYLGTDKAMLHDCSSHEGEFLPVVQKTILVKDAWTEEVSHTSYQCSCGEVMDGETISYIEGDVNGDGEVSIADVVLIQKWILGVRDVELSCWEAGDLVCDEEINVFDLCMLKRKLIENN